MRQHHKILAPTIAAVLAGLGSMAAEAVSLPPSAFTYNVFSGGSAACAVAVQPAGGTCTSGASFATGDGGVLNNTGTSVLEKATGPGVVSLATLTYYFEVGGPAVPGGQIAVDIISSGAAAVLGGAGFSVASMVITDAGSDAGIASGTPDPDLGFVVDSHADSVSCAFGRCTEFGAAWSQTTQLQADHLCLTQGDLYAITIIAGSSALGSGAVGTAMVDPKIIVDPTNVDPTTSSCFQPSNPQDYTVSVSAGASTGAPVPEPGTLGLMGLGLFAIGLQRLTSRRTRARA